MCIRDRFQREGQPSREFRYGAAQVGTVVDSDLTVTIDIAVAETAHAVSYGTGFGISGIDLGSFLRRGNSILCRGRVDFSLRLEQPNYICLLYTSRCV